MKGFRPLLALVFLSFIAHAHAQLDLGTPTSRTPYDAYLTPMWTVLHQLSGKADPNLAAELVRRGRSFRYCYKADQPYVPQTPEETDSLHAGDCKAKSLWVASKLNDRNIRFVIGKAKQAANTSHAWLMWDGPNGWMILDATLYSTPLVPTRLSPTEFIPTYSFSPTGKYAHHAGTTGQAKNGDHF